MKKALVTNGVVENIIAVDPLNIPDWCADWPDVPEGNEDAEIGGGYSNGVFSPAPTPAITDADRAKMSLSFAQLLIGLVTEAWITGAEGEAWLTGTLPAPVLSLVAGLPADQQFAAKARAIAPSIVMRNDSLVVSLGAAQGKTEAELDTFFKTYALV